MSLKLGFVFLCATVVIDWYQGAGSSVCPESKKLYPGDCRLFYKCVPLSESAQAYVWVPSRCTAGLVYEPRLQSCVFPREGRDCEQEPDEDFVENSFYSLNRGASVEGARKMTDYSAASTVQTDTSTSGFNDNDKSTKINSVSSTERNKSAKGDVLTMKANNPDPDPIGAQMHRLRQLINSLKATSSPHNNIAYYGYTSRPPFPMDHSALDLSFPFKQGMPHFPVQELNLLPAQIYKIMAQLISQTPYPNIHQTNLDSLKPQTKYSTPASTINANYELVSSLFQKYLANTTFLKHGEFINCRTGDRLPNRDDCTKYHICSGKTKLNFTCPQKLAFNKLKSVCDSEGFQRCGELEGNDIF